MMDLKTNLLSRRNFLRFTTGIGIAVGLDGLIPPHSNWMVEYSGNWVFFSSSIRAGTN